MRSNLYRRALRTEAHVDVVAVVTGRFPWMISERRAFAVEAPRDVLVAGDES